MKTTVCYHFHCTCSALLQYLNAFINAPSYCIPVKLQFCMLTYKSLGYCSY